MNMTDHKYKLNHWRLVCIGNAVSATGNLHARPGYPDGIEIQTSSIRSWDLSEEDMLIYTANSIYRCPLREYIVSSDSLPFIGLIPNRSELTIDDLEEAIWNKLWNITDDEVVHFRHTIASYLSNLRNNGLPDQCVLFRWEGCDIPYLKQVIVYRDGQIQIDDLPYARPIYKSCLTLSSDRSMDISSDRDTRKHYFRHYAIDPGPVLIENTGDQDLYLNTGQRENVRIPSGAITHIP